MNQFDCGGVCLNSHFNFAVNPFIKPGTWRSNTKSQHIIEYIHGKEYTNISRL